VECFQLEVAHALSADLAARAGMGTREDARGAVVFAAVWPRRGNGDSLDGLAFLLEQDLAPIDESRSALS